MARVTITGKSRAAGSDVSLARSVLLRRNPEGEELVILKMKAKADGLVRERRQIVHTFPTNRLQGFVGCHGNTISRRETREDLAGLVQNFDAQFALGISHIDEQMLSSEAHWPGRQRASLFSRVHRGKPVTTKRGQPCRQEAGLVVAGPARSAADVEVKLVSHNQESSAGRLDIVGIPVALPVRNRESSAPIGPVEGSRVAWTGSVGRSASHKRLD